MFKILTFLVLFCFPALADVNNSSLQQQITGYGSPTSIGGSHQTGFGYYVLHSAGASLGIDETAFGSNALKSDISGAENTAIGESALTNLTSGTNNVAVGSSAAANTNGHFNTAIGTSAMEVATGGNNNSAVGVSALNSLQDGGDNNSALGTQAAKAVTTGKYNTANGMQSLYSVTTGNGNSALGYQAGQSGSAPTVTGSNNTFLGFGTGSNLDASSSTAVGTGAIITSNHQIVLGTSSETTVIRGNLVVDGSCTGCGTGGASNSFGNWTVGGYSFNTIYQAASDGFVVLWGNTASTAYAYVACYTDAAASPSTDIANSAITGGGTVNVTFPVKKNHYWKCYQSNISSTKQISWIPLN